MTSIQVAAGSLPLVSSQRTSSSRISAAVPGIVSSPASFAAVSQSRIDSPVRDGAVDDLHRAERVHVHVRHPLLHLAGDVEVRGAGQVGVDAALHADLGRAERPRLLGAVADLVQRQRVGVGVGAPLRERAEPAAGVADVGEVDVPVDDVGDVVADDVARAASSASAATASSSAPSACSSASACGVGQAGRVALGARAARRRTSESSRARRAPVRTASSRTVVPVAVDAVEVARAGRSVRPSVSIAVCRSMRPSDVPARPRAPATAGPAARRPSRASPSRLGQRGDVRHDPRVEPRLAGLARTSGRPSAARRSSNPASARCARRARRSAATAARG